MGCAPREKRYMHNTKKSIRKKDLKSDSEKVGFEPTVRKTYMRLAIALFRPLRHFSNQRVTAY